MLKNITHTHAQPRRYVAAPVSSPAVIAPTHEDIARRAYDLYLHTGRIQGQCAQNWAQAEQSLRDQEQALLASQSASAETPRADR